MIHVLVVDQHIMRRISKMTSTWPNVYMLMLVHTAYDVRMIIMIYFDVYADDYDLVTFTFCTELFAVFRIHSWGLGLCRDTP